MPKYSISSQFYRKMLLEDCLPFWEKNSIDRKFGGFLTCLDRQGRPYETDKFMWQQGRQIWTFAMLYNRLEKRKKWLAIAEHGVKFIKKYGRDDEGNYYFVLDRSGKPLVQPCSIFSDCFACMALSQYAMASGDEESKSLALAAYHNILKRKSNPKGKYSKAYPGTRPLISFSLPMILSNLVLELEWLLDKKTLDDTINACIHEVMTLFYDRKSGLIYEHVSPDGSHPDCFDGRLMNPGHGIEAMWFLMDIAKRNNDMALVNKTCDITLNILNFAWDKKYGGIFYFMDAMAKPMLQLEWDQKLWWVHQETLVALIKGYNLTGRKELWDWFKRLHAYSWKHFHDPKYGGWFNYLNRRGEVLLETKGCKWDGCFHLPRSLYLIQQELKILERQ